MPAVCQLIREWKLSRIEAGTFLSIKRTTTSAILKDILDIGFCHLRLLNLGNNYIVSIEGMDSLMMPELEELYLCKHPITKEVTASLIQGP